MKSLSFKIGVLSIVSIFPVIYTYAQDTILFRGKIGKTLAESEEWRPAKIEPPLGAPNIIWVLLDDVGFGASATFGGGISTPVFDRLAKQGLRYTNFHTTGVCAPSRAALLTGRNHHAVGMGNFADPNNSFGFPGYQGRIPSSAGTIAEILKENGYSTFAVGKWGITPDVGIFDIPNPEFYDAGPFDYWPIGKGFEHYYGFLGSETDQYKVPLVEDAKHIEPDGRHLSELITDKAITYIDNQKKQYPDKPFFLYYAPAGTHLPHQVEQKWRDLYKDQFHEGWDIYRQEVFQRQKDLGIIPSDAKLGARHPSLRAWSSLSADERRLSTKFMQNYAGFLTYTDYEIGRIVSKLKELNQLENTLIFLVIGDNGASRAGGEHGMTGQPYKDAAVIKEQGTLKYNLDRIDGIGTRDSYDDFPHAWAQATNTPFNDWKSDADAEGATRNPLIVFYPKLIKDNGGIRNHYSHLIDILPTTLDIVGISSPEKVKGVEQQPIQGSSLKPTLIDADSPEVHKTQYYYIFGSRAIYHNGWKAAAHHYPSLSDFFVYHVDLEDIDSDFNKDIWRLYNLNEDFNELNDLSAKYSGKLEELKNIFHGEALKNNVYPLIDWGDIINRGNKNRTK